MERDRRMANDTGGGSGSIPCLFIVVLLVALLVVYVIIWYYTRQRMKSEVRRHKCDYCGRLTVAVSKCHYAQVQEKLGSIKCSKCSKEAIPVCSICKKPMDLKGLGRPGLEHSEFGD